MQYEMKISGETFELPSLSTAPAIYAVNFEDGSQYVGQAANLRKRWNGYVRAISPEEMERRQRETKVVQQTTNVRMKARILEELKSGRAVTLDVMTAINLDGSELDLRNKHMRSAAEQIEIARRLRSGVSLINK